MKIILELIIHFKYRCLVVCCAYLIFQNTLIAQETPLDSIQYKEKASAPLNIEDIFFYGIWNTNKISDYSVVTGTPFLKNKKFKVTSTLLDNPDSKILMLENRLGTQGYATDEGAGMIIDTDELYIHQQSQEDIQGGFWTILDDNKINQHTLKFSLQDNFRSDTGLHLAHLNKNTEYVLTLNERKNKCSDDFGLEINVDGKSILGKNNFTHKLLHGNSIYFSGARVNISRKEGSCDKKGDMVTGTLKINTSTNHIFKASDRFAAGFWRTNRAYPSQIISERLSSSIASTFNLSSNIWDDDVNSRIYYYNKRNKSLGSSYQSFEGAGFVTRDYELYVHQDNKELNHSGNWEILSDFRKIGQKFNFSLGNKIGSEVTIAALDKPSEAIITFRNSVGNSGCLGQVLFTIRVDGVLVKGFRGDTQKFLPGSSVLLKGKHFQVFMASGTCPNRKLQSGYIKFPR